MQVIGNRIKEVLERKAMEAKDLSLIERKVKELQQAIEKPKKVTGLLNGNYLPTLDEVFTAARVLEVPAEDIVILSE